MLSFLLSYLQSSPDRPRAAIARKIYLCVNCNAPVSFRFTKWTHQPGTAKQESAEATSLLCSDACTTISMTTDSFTWTQVEGPRSSPRTHIRCQVFARCTRDHARTCQFEPFLLVGCFHRFPINVHLVVPFISSPHDTRRLCSCCISCA